MDVLDRQRLNASIRSINQTESNATLVLDDTDPFYDFVHALYIFVIPLISIFGIIGNTISVKVFICSSFNKQPSSIYLAALSVSETLFLAVLLIGWLGSFDSSFQYSITLCMISVYVSYVTGFLSVWYMSLIVIDRYIVVCHPLRGPRLCSRQRTKLASAIVTIFAMLLYSHSFMTIKIINNPSGPKCDYREEAISFIRLATYIDSALTVFLPFLLIFVLNCCLISAIRRFRKKHVHHGDRKYYSYSPQYSILTKAQIKLTFMLIIVSSVFLVLNLPSHVIRLYILLNDLTEQRHGHLNVVLTQQILQMLYYANFAINFVLYMTTSKMFRKCLRENPKCYRSNKAREHRV